MESGTIARAIVGPGPPSAVSDSAVAGCSMRIVVTQGEQSWAGEEGVRTLPSLPRCNS